MTKPSPINKLCFPDFLENWPWPRRVNPHFHEVKAESDAWIESFRCFDAQDMKAFNHCNSSLLSAQAYPLMSKDHLRTACDMMNLFFVIEGYTDVADPGTVQALATIVMDALRHPQLPRPNDENVLGEISKQFWERGIKSASRTSANRFVNAFDAYVKAVADESKDRDHGHIRDVKTYMSLRRFTIGGKPSFALLELGMNLPDGIIEHPVMEKLTETALDLIILGNDMYSYNKERAEGNDAHNIVTVIMHHHNQTVTGAMEWVEVELRRLVDEFLQLTRFKPFWTADVEDLVYEYISGLGNWVRANESWSFESGRYFGNEGLNVQRVRCVGLLPRVKKAVDVL